MSKNYTYRYKRRTLRNLRLSELIHLCESCFPCSECPLCKFCPFAYDITNDELKQYYNRKITIKYRYERQVKPKV